MASKVPLQNLTIERGDDETIIVQVRKNTGTEGNPVWTPIDITGSTIFFTAKVSPTDADNQAVISTSNTSHTDPVNGLSYIALSHTLTTVAASTYFYDIQWVDAAGNVKTIMKGKLTVEQDITQRTA